MLRPARTSLPSSLNSSVTRPVVCTVQSVRANSSQMSRLLAELKELRESCLAMEQEFGASIAEACPQSRRSVQNLLDYLALRKHDLRDMQSRLAALGLSSLGRSESSTLAGIEAVTAILESLAGEQPSVLSPTTAAPHTAVPQAA